MKTTNKDTLDIFDYTQQKLKAHYQNDKEFNRELATIYEFYKIKLSSILTEDQREKMEKMLEESIKQQIFNGYYMGLELLQSDYHFENEWFQQSEGMIAQQLPDLLRRATNNQIEEVVTDKTLQRLMTWLVVEYEGVYPLLMDISLNTACMGLKWALKDEGSKRQIDLYESSFKGMLGNLDDITFITPQSYIQLVVTNEGSEVWEIINSDYKTLEKIGEVNVVRIDAADNTDRYYLNISVKDSLSESEQKSLIEDISARVMMFNDVERAHLTLTASTVREYYSFQ